MLCAYSTLDGRQALSLRCFKPSFHIMSSMDFSPSISALPILEGSLTQISIVPSLLFAAGFVE